MFIFTELEKTIDCKVFRILRDVLGSVSVERASQF